MSFAVWVFVGLWILDFADLGWIVLWLSVGWARYSWFRDMWAVAWFWFGYVYAGFVGWWLIMVCGLVMSLGFGVWSGDFVVCLGVMCTLVFWVWDW